MATSSSPPQKQEPKTPLYIDLFAAQGILAAILWATIGLIGTLPRNPDNSMKAIFVVPTFVALAGASAYLLKRRILPHRALRIVAWVIIGFSVLIIPVSLLDSFRWSGS
jgi:hypothetical protein